MFKNNYFNISSKDFHKLNIALTDFGTASLGSKYQIKTTLSYRAPVVLMGAECGYSCDVWSI